jgi:hypothetical protein
VVVGLDVANLSELELQQEVLKLRRRVQKLAALLRLALSLLRVSGCTLSGERLPDGQDKLRILRAVDQPRACIPLRALLRLLHLSPSRFHAWRRRHTVCALDDQSSWPRTSPHRLTPSEIRVIHDMVTSPLYRHVPTRTLAVLAQRLGTVWASASTWYRFKVDPRGDSITTLTVSELTNAGSANRSAIYLSPGSVACNVRAPPVADQLNNLARLA